MKDQNEDIPVVGEPLAVVNVRGRGYELRVSPRDIIDADRKSCASIIDHQRRIIWVDRRLNANPWYGIRVAALVVAAAWRAARAYKGEAWRGTAGAGGASARRTAPTERLPAGELTPFARDLLECEWKLLAPPGWKLPADLPAGVRLEPWGSTDGDRNGRPPQIWSTSCALCPNCSKPYRSFAWLERHLVEKHGWSRDAGQRLMPPGFATPDNEHRKAA
jgi:hypothetical protein